MKVAPTLRMQDPWQIDENDFPAQAGRSQRLRFLLNYAVLAPSSHNTQPWRFMLGDEFLELCPDRTRALPVVDPKDRALTISCGAALGHLQVAARYFGYRPITETFPDPKNAELFARIRLGESVEPSSKDARLFAAIKNRRTTRRRYDDRPLPESLVKDCSEAAARASVELRFMADPGVRSDIATLISQGDRIQFADPAFRRELGSWVHSKRAASHDGMSGEGFGMPDVLSSVGAMVIRTFDLGKGVAAKDQEIAANSPTLALLATHGDEPEAWLRVGQVLSHVLLNATASGVTAAYLNQPIEVDALRPRLREVAGVKGFPQILMRMGFGPKLAPTVRRPVDEVLATAAHA
ncbi:MAG: nitroreductase [Gammaproteobacteria bacterium]|nr:nitroreductase [Gammaproteobacteria bacterium]MDH3413201.1 nitroreductase [Gammaproteobacteria bacterium]